MKNRRLVGGGGGGVKREREYGWEPGLLPLRAKPAKARVSFWDNPAGRCRPRFLCPGLEGHNGKLRALFPPSMGLSVEDAGIYL